MTSKEIKAKAAQFAKFVEWSKEDGCFIGRCPALFGGGVHGGDEATVYRELCEAVEEWVTLLEREDLPLLNGDAGKTYSGKFVLRVDPALYRRLALKAIAEGDSLNNYVTRKLAHS